MTKRHLQIQILVPVDEPYRAARSLWAQMTAEERSVMGRLAAEFVLLAEASGDQRVVVAPAATLEAAGLPFSGASDGESRR